MTVRCCTQLFNAYTPCAYTILNPFGYFVRLRKTVFSYCTRTAPEYHTEVTR